MKKATTVLWAATVLSAALLAVSAKNVFPAYAQTPNKNCNELSITLLHPYIDSAITGFYGHSRRYEIGDSSLEIVERDGNIFTVKVKVDTFEGAHNDYFTETLLFRITPLDVMLEKYVHSDFTA